jgi:hypothetical protein
MGRTGRSASVGEGITLVERVVALAVRNALDERWSAHDAALALLDVTTDISRLRRARARVSEVVLASPSLAGTRAIAALNVALARLEADLPAGSPWRSARSAHSPQSGRVPVQRPDETPPVPPSRPGEPHVVTTYHVSGTPDSLREAAMFVAAHTCPEHAATEGGRAMLLAQELLAQTVGQTGQPAHLVLTCDGHAVTVYVDLAAEPAALDRLRSSTPDLTLVEQLADQWGSACLRPGVRYWVTVGA